MENQKDITELYQERTYEELTEVLNEWLNPSESSDEETEDAPAAAVASATKVEDASAAFDELFSK